jgi:hypothetical protein
MNINEQLAKAAAANARIAEAIKELETFINRNK